MRKGVYGFLQTKVDRGGYFAPGIGTILDKNCLLILKCDTAQKALEVKFDFP